MRHDLSTITLIIVTPRRPSETAAMTCLVDLPQGSLPKFYSNALCFETFDTTGYMSTCGHTLEYRKPLQKGNAHGGHGLDRWLIDLSAYQQHTAPSH